MKYATKEISEKKTALAPEITEAFRNFYNPFFKLSPNSQ